MLVLLTGARGSIGRVLTIGLAARGHRVRGLDLVHEDVAAFADEYAGGYLVGDCLDPRIVDRAVDGVDAVAHFAGIPHEASLPDSLASHVVSTGRILDAMVRHGTGRIVYASSNHAVGRTPRDGLLGVDVRPRPDTYYGVSKVAAEGLLSLYADRDGVDAVALRIGSFLEHPTTRRALATWLSPADCVRIVDAALTADISGFQVIYGVSSNTDGWWDLGPGRELGYAPVDDAALHAHTVPERPDDAAENAVVGGPFAIGQDDRRPFADDLVDAARLWIDDDPDPDTRRELTSLADSAERGDANAREDLTDRFRGTLSFGTAGLRGAIGAGPNRMNRSVVIKAAAGLAAHLLASGDVGGVVVIGYDARHKSDVFATDTAAVMSAAGLDAVVLPEPLPTPVLAFAIGHLGAVAGVMVTASHNPPADNGYKVYLGDGSQIVPPVDSEIAAQISRVASVGGVARGDSWRTAGPDLLDAYVAAVAGLVDPAAPRELRTVYTPLHGVGDDTLQRVLTAAGFAAPLPVVRQQQPDPDFPTVAFPNPEEPGALDLALELAQDHDQREPVDLVIANDPDADRCAVAVPSTFASGRRPAWRVLRGDELGILLADAVTTRPVAERSAGDVRGVLATTIVSSSLLSRLAPARGFGYAETLTGFKWIGRVPELVYGYEEALGYCVAPGLVRDKDGISALLLVVELAARLKAEGRTLLDRLHDLYAEFGVHATDQLSVRVSDLAQIAGAMTHLRDQPPLSLGGLAVEHADDLSAGTSELPATDGLRYRLADGARVVVRPSGTEPKLKCYLEVVVRVEQEDAVPQAPRAAHDTVAAAQVAAVGRLDAIRADLTEALGL